MKRRVRLRWATGIAALLLAAGAFAFVASDSAGVTAADLSNPHVGGRNATHGHSTPTIAQELAELDTSQSAHGLTVQSLEHTTGAPSCKPPPIPAATYPPGHTYGVPFLAAVTNGQILFGYDEWVANNTTYVDKQGQTFDLSPWLTKVFDITGWVTGLLQLPNLSAEVSSEDVVICAGDATTCEADGPQPGCIYLSLDAAPFPRQPPPTPITNVPPTGKACQGSPFCIPYSVDITPVGNTTLTVTGVQADGALNLSVKTSAITIVSLTEQNGTSTCQNAQTNLTLTTQAAGLPPGSPTLPTSGNPDYRSLQIPPAPLTGPLASASSTLATNDFSVPAFPLVSPCTFATTLDAPLGGWNALNPKLPPSENNNYYDKNPLPADAGTPGWGQFTATTTVAMLGLPVGPPPNFSF